MAFFRMMGACWGRRRARAAGRHPGGRHRSGVQHGDAECACGPRHARLLRAHRPPGAAYLGALFPKLDRYQTALHLMQYNMGLTCAAQWCLHFFPLCPPSIAPSPRIIASEVPECVSLPELSQPAFHQRLKFIGGTNGHPPQQYNNTLHVCTVPANFEGACRVCGTQP